VLAQRWRQAKDAARAARAQPALQRLLPKGAAVLSALESLHLEQLEAAGAFDAALAVLREDLSGPWACGRLIEFLCRHGRHAEALAEAERADAAFPGDWMLQTLLLRCCEHAGRTVQALALRRRMFDQRPDVGGYGQLLQAARAAGRDVSALREELLAALAAREEDIVKQQQQTGMKSCGQVPPGVRDVTLRADILAAEGRWGEACALVQPPAWCHERTLRHIALHLGAEQRGDAVRLLQRLLEDAMARASSPYEQELALVEEAARRMDAAPRAAWLSELRLLYKPKRNFIKGLPAG
jgi:tetratricopeptide (TPR) repeat protein